MTKDTRSCYSCGRDVHGACQLPYCPFRRGVGEYDRKPRVPKPRTQISVRIPPKLIEYAEREAYIRSARPPYKAVSLSDIIRMALIHFQATSAAKVELANEKLCTSITHGTMTFCATCGLSWETNDPLPPACLLEEKK